MRSSLSRARCCGLSGTFRWVAFFAFVVIVVLTIPIATATAQDPGTAWTWGRNIYGELGDGTIGEVRPTPAQFGALMGVIAAAESDRNTVVGVAVA